MGPRYKRLKREGRLQVAKHHWLPKFDGKNIVKGYSKHFAVDKLCAVFELRMLGYEISETYVDQLKVDVEHRRLANENKKRLKELEEQQDDWSDETFAFIAGHTSNGVPYGVTWGEMDDCEGDYLDEELPF